MESEKLAWSLEGTEVSLVERLDTDPISVLREYVFTQITISYKNKEVNNHIIDCGTLGVLFVYYSNHAYRGQWIDSLERLNSTAVESRLDNRQQELLSWMKLYEKLHKKNAPHFELEHSVNKAALELLHKITFPERDALKSAFDMYARSSDRNKLATEMAGIIHTALIGPTEQTVF